MAQHYVIHKYIIPIYTPYIIYKYIIYIALHYCYIICTLCITLFYIICKYCGPGSSVGIATDYGLDGPGSNPGGGVGFPPIQTGPGAHPVSCKMGAGSFPG